MKKIPKPPGRSKGRDKLDALVNRESMSMIDRMAEHQKIMLKDRYAEQVASGTLTAKDLVDIDMGFLIQEIAGLKVLLRGDINTAPDPEYIEVTREELGLPSAGEA